MMSRRSRRVQQHLLKARDAALAAVDNYNRPGTSFRTRTFVLLMTVAWTSCFHAIFYDKKINPWYVKRVAVAKVLATTELMAIRNTGNCRNA